MKRQQAGKIKLRAADRRQRALDLRLGGKTYNAIGAALGISHQAAHKLVMTALDDIRTQTAEDAVKVRALELERINAIVDALWPKRKDPRAADSLMRAMDRKARLLGLDAPLQVDAAVASVAVTDDEQRAARIAAILDRARARRDGQPAPGDERVAALAGAATLGLPQPG